MTFFKCSSPALEQRSLLSSLPVNLSCSLPLAPFPLPGSAGKNKNRRQGAGPAKQPGSCYLAFGGPQQGESPRKSFLWVPRENSHNKPQGSSSFCFLSFPLALLSSSFPPSPPSIHEHFLSACKCWRQAQSSKQNNHNF